MIHSTQPIINPLEEFKNNVVIVRKRISCGAIFRIATIGILVGIGAGISATKRKISSAVAGAVATAITCIAAKIFTKTPLSTAVPTTILATTLAVVSGACVTTSRETMALGTLLTGISVIESALLLGLNEISAVALGTSAAAGLSEIIGFPGLIMGIGASMAAVSVLGFDMMVHEFNAISSFKTDFTRSNQAFFKAILKNSRERSSVLADTKKILCLIIEQIMICPEMPTTQNTPGFLHPQLNSIQSLQKRLQKIKDSAKFSLLSQPSRSMPKTLRCLVKDVMKCVNQLFAQQDTQRDLGKVASAQAAKDFGQECHFGKRANFIKVKEFEKGSS